MLTVHHLGISQSERIPWVCEELEIPYEFIRYDRDPQTRLAPPAYKKLLPFGTAPVITDGDVALGESGAILEYICAKYGNGRLMLKVGDADYPEYLYWFHFANASMMATAMVDMVIAALGATESEGLVKALSRRSTLVYEVTDQRLAKADYLGGKNLTIADINMVFPLTTMRAFSKVDISPYPNICRYLQRIGARPAYQRAMAKAEPGMTPVLT